VYTITEMGRLYFILGLLLFLFVSYWFIAHSFVIVRLTAVFSLLFVIAFVLGGWVWIRSFLRK
jgi:hypothetical protein